MPDMRRYISILSDCCSIMHGLSSNAQKYIITKADGPELLHIITKHKHILLGHLLPENQDNVNCNSHYLILFTIKITLINNIQIYRASILVVL
jgi:hypothetical protein